MNKILRLFLFLILIGSCSIDQKSGIWTKKNKIEIENPIEVKELFKDDNNLSHELNSNVRIQLKSKLSKKSFTNNLTNNNGRINYDGNLETISRYKFSKIDSFNEYQPELLITNNNTLVFFDEKGTILNFGKNNKLIWKKNIYSKIEKKQKPILYFASNNETLFVADNLAKYYALNINTGEVIWSKNNIAPFNSQIKTFKDKFFVIDFENILRCFSIKDGKEIWNFKTEKSFIKSQQKLSFVINDNKIIFINTLGDLSSVDIETGNLVWQTPTQSSAIYENYFSLKNSD